MPICKKCDTSFPNRKMIKKKERNFSKRKYCLECSPFNNRNTLKLENGDERKSLTNRKCGCNKVYRHKGSRCYSCTVKIRRHKIKMEMVNKKGGKCSKCGYNECLSALQFHHINPKTKAFSISGSHCRSMSRVKKELNKCIVLCANCHSKESCKNSYCSSHEACHG